METEKDLNKKLNDINKRLDKIENALAMINASLAVLSSKIASDPGIWPPNGPLPCPLPYPEPGLPWPGPGLPWPDGKTPITRTTTSDRTTPYDWM